MSRQPSQPRCKKCQALVYPELGPCERVSFRTSWFSGGSRRRFGCPRGGAHDVDDSQFIGTYATAIRWRGRTARS